MLGRVAKWLLFHFIEINDYLEAKKPLCTSKAEWWVLLNVVKVVMADYVNITCRSLQSLTVLASQQAESLVKLSCQIWKICYISCRHLEASKNSDTIVKYGDFSLTSQNPIRFIKNQGKFVYEKFSCLEEPVQK